MGAFVNEGTLHLSCILPTKFRVRGGKYEGAIWTRSQDQGRIILSFRHGRVMLYGKVQKRKGARRKLQNLSTQVNWLSHRLDAWCSEALHADPGFAALSWKEQNRQTTDLRLKARMILRPLILQMAREHGLLPHLPSEILDESPENVGLSRLIGGILYPVTAEFYGQGVEMWDVLPSSVSPALRGRTLNEVAKRAFGRENKKLVRLLGESFLHYRGDADPEMGNVRRMNLDNFQLALIARGYVPVDDLYEILSWKYPQGGRARPTMIQLSRNQLRLCRRFLKRFSRDRILRFLKEIHDSRGQRERLLLDICKMFFDPEIGDQLFGLPAKPKSLHELHDEIARQWRRMERKSENQAEALPVPRKLKKLEGERVGDLTLLVPHTVRELSAWGHEMRNCVGSYHREIRAGRSLVLGFERDGRLIYNLEIWTRRKQLAQFSTHCNKAPDPKDREMVVNWLIEHEILAPRENPTAAQIQEAEPLIQEWYPLDPFIDEEEEPEPREYALHA